MGDGVMARYIDADKLMLDINCHGTNKFGMLDEDIREFINNQPTADVAEVKHGVWEVVDEAEPRRYGCSKCKRLSWTADNYCSYCGAKMDGERRTDEEPT